MTQSRNGQSTIEVQNLLDRLRAGDSNAADRLLDVSIERLRYLSRRILSDIPAVRRWEETDDVLQNSSVRLWKALEKHHPATPLDYFRLAAFVIRRELIDLSRHHFGPEGVGLHLANQGPSRQSGPFSPVEQQADETNDPDKLSKWADFHEYVEQLPDDERALFDLLWYQGMGLEEASVLLGSSERTVRRNWKLVRLRLYRDLLENTAFDSM